MALLDRLVATTLPIVPKPIVRYFSRRYIAGERLEDAIRVTRQLNREGAMATIDVLGEHVSDPRQCEEAVLAYETVLDAIEAEKLDSNISVKPTHMGLKISYELCLNNLRRLVRKAASLNNFVRIDMEDSTCTADTIRLYRHLRQEFTNVGLVLQAYLRRSHQDIEDLLALKPNVRVCKGIYVEPREIAYKDKEIIRRNFAWMMETLLRHGSYIGIATHDERLVWEGYRLVREFRVPPQQYEFQMLLGVDDQLRRIILRDGHRLRVYVPFGREWYAYSLRRLRENPQIAGYVFRALFRRDGQAPGAN
ncbi:MAG: proline dehydrogenase family protein [candidate division KSB1 bacterium]|nr:proline dehydrogenase family protein [candidate division KSB1 bacterium]